MWLVGEYIDDNDWYYNGIFSTKEKAADACKNSNYFVAQVPDIDEHIPEERSIFPLMEYPIKTCHKD